MSKVKYTLALAATLLCTAVEAQSYPLPQLPPLPQPSAPSAPPATKPQTDPRLIQALKAAGLKYSVLPDGNCRIGLKLPNGRHQGVIVQTHTEQFGSLELREIGSLADSMASQLSKDIIVKAMTEASKQKIGAWEIVPLRGTEYGLVLVARLPVSVTPDELGRWIYSIALGADKAEATLTEKDEL